MSYIGNIPEDFDPNEPYKSPKDNYDPWNFEEKEKEEGILYSRINNKIRKKYPR